MEGRTKPGAGPTPSRWRWRKGAPFRVTLILLLVTPLAGGILGYWAAHQHDPPPLTTRESPPSSAAWTWDLVIPAILIDPDDPGTYDWTDCPWVNGSGTYGDPFRITNLTIDGAGSQVPLVIQNTAKYFRVENVTCLNPGSFNRPGVSLSTAHNGTLHNVTCSGLPYRGVALDGCSNLTVSHSNATGNGEKGFYLNGCTNLTVSGANSSGNVGTGIYLSGGANITIIESNVTSNGEGEIDIYSTINATLVGNTVTNWGIGVDGAHNITITGNFLGDALLGVNLKDTWNATITNNDLGSLGLRWEDEDVIRVRSATISPDNSVAGHPLRFVKDQDGVTGLAESGEVILVGCNETEVAGLDAPITLVDCHNISLTGNNCTGGLEGIRATATSNLTLFENNCSHVYLSGIKLVGGHAYNLTGNNCSHAGYYGLEVEDAWDAWVSGNEFNGTGYYGAVITGGGNITLVGNDLSNTASSSLRAWNVPCLNATGNTCLDAGATTFDVQSTFGGSFTDNVVSGGAGSGFALSSCHNATFTGNNVTGKVGAGLTLATCHNATFTGNNCTGNGYAGIVLQVGHNATFTDNTCGYNGAPGISLWQANDATLAGDWCGRNAQAGLMINDSTGVSGTGLTCWKSIGAPVFLDSLAHDNVLAGCTIIKNGTAIHDGGTNNVFPGLVTVNLPVATATASETSLIAGQSLQFTGQVFGGVGPFTYSWAAGDATADFFGTTPTHAYATAGDFTATLTVTDAEGDTAQDMVAIHVETDIQPVVSFTVSNATPAPGQTITVTAAPAGGNGGITYAWDWGDGTAQASGLTATHTYDLMGNYTVTLTVTDVDGDSSITSLLVSVSDLSGKVEGDSDGDQPPNGNENDISLPTEVLVPILFLGGLLSIFRVLIGSKRYRINTDL